MNIFIETAQYKFQFIIIIIIIIIIVIIIIIKDKKNLNMLYTPRKKTELRKCRNLTLV